MFASRRLSTCLVGVSVTAVAITCLATLRPSTAVAAATRNPYQQPFTSTSIWNMPIGSGAQYVPGTVAPPTVRAMTPDEVITLMDPSAPITTVVANGGQHANRCAGGAPMTTAPIPPSLVVPSATYNDGYAVLGADGSSILEGSAFARCAPGAPATAWTAKLFGTIEGDGLTGAAGGSGLSSLGGILRINELVPGGQIDHALRVDVDAAANLFAGPNGYRWPATHEDGYGPTTYGGTNPALKMGSLLALPASLDLASLGLTSGPGMILAKALQDYGAYISNDTRRSVFSIATETGDASMIDQFQSLWGYPFQTDGVSGTPWADDVMTILSHLEVVDNNGPASIGGGGNPIVPMAPPLSSTPTPPSPVPTPPAAWSGASSLGDGPLAGDPQSVSPAPGRIDVFWRGGDNALWYAWYANGWHGPAGLAAPGGSALASDPHPVATGGGTVDVFWRGADGNVWHAYALGGGPLTGPDSLGGGPLGSAEPQPVSSGHGDVAVFWQGTDANLWEAAYQPRTGWRSQIGLGDGPLGGTPHPAAFAAGSYDVFWKGTDGAIWHAYSLGGSWSGPQYLGMGPLASDPVAFSTGNHITDVYWRGTDGGLWHAWYNAGWAGPQGYGGSVASAPSPLSFDPGALDVFWRDGSNLDHLVDGTVTSLSLSGVSGDISAFSWGGGHEEVFWKGADGNLWHAWAG